MPYFQNSFEAYDIKYTVVSEVNFSITINKGRLIQIIDNIINNSLYWIKVRKEQDPSYAPQISIVIDKPWIYIYDNGYGIANSVEDSLFEPFVTTKPRGKGRGLGLFIISQLLDAVGCSIMLEQRRNKYNKRYIFAINLSNVLI
jgi:C4-dicarboxylate-specific signal transduction histidine kinase